VPVGRNRPARHREEKAVKRVRNPEGGKEAGVGKPTSGGGVEPGPRDPEQRRSSRRGLAVLMALKGRQTP
jgi:hypothetical protein